jgi:hypothetical protein
VFKERKKHKVPKVVGRIKILVSITDKMTARNMAEYYASRTPTVTTPPERYLTPNLDPTKLMPETRYRNRYLIATQLFIQHCSPPLFFFQVLNDNNPDGKYILSYCDFP